MFQYGKRSFFRQEKKNFRSIKVGNLHSRDKGKKKIRTASQTERFQLLIAHRERELGSCYGHTIKVFLSSPPFPRAPSGSDVIPPPASWFSIHSFFLLLQEQDGTAMNRRKMTTSIRHQLATTGSFLTCCRVGCCCVQNQHEFNQVQ